MDNRRNPDRDRMLEDILNNFDNDNKRTTSPGSNRNYTSRNNSVRSAPRKNVNPAAYSNDYQKTTGFAVSKTDRISQDEIPVSDAATTKLEIPEKNNNYQEYNTVNMQRAYTSDTQMNIRNNADYSQENFNDEPVKIRKANNESAYNGQNVPNRPSKRKKRKKRSARLPIVLMVTTLIFTVSICLSILIIAVGRDMLAIGKGDAVKMVTIPEGANAQSVAAILEEEGIIDIPKAFEIFSGMSGSDELFIPGQYELSPADAYETIIGKLTTEADDDSRETAEVTFIEGTSIYDAAKILEEKGVCSADRFIYYFNAGGYGFDFEEKLPTSTATKFYRMEGYLFPETYKFYLDSEPQSVCMKIYQNFENKMTDEYYRQMQKKGMTLDEVITLASIVQAEAPTAESMKKVAGVFYNRLSNEEDFPMLQLDPTTYYVEEIIKPNIQIKSTAIFEAYDTYQGYGLPPGAIGNPGIDAIEAVLYPDDNNYYYFCADIDTLEIYYSETLEEHEENLAIINGEVSEDDDDSDDEYYEEDYYYE
ncbi:MAG: endolytic transglycosylase MltG [Oscillospiraceae bacterium]|nr:endolytic transglycosylase MltG [Oscillospiraceae bacterium]